MSDPVTVARFESPTAKVQLLLEPPVVGAGRYCATHANESDGLQWSDWTTDRAAAVREFLGFIRRELEQ